ncbi:hypothetical protein SUDANB106_04663 [Streptomyces sp. enrichment culture]
MPGPEAESGRGPALVEALASRWCVAGRPYRGKTVRAESDPGEERARRAGHRPHNGYSLEMPRLSQRREATS